MYVQPSRQSGAGFIKYMVTAASQRNMNLIPLRDTAIAARSYSQASKWTLQVDEGLASEQLHKVGR
jgi:hypothetical protein